MNSRIDTRRQKIIAYNSKYDCSPLHFVDYHRKTVEIDNDDLRFNADGSPNIKRLVLTILSMSERLFSFSESGIAETSPGRNRSSLDIWRHAKLLYPDIDVFRIMEVLYKLSENGDLFVQYCHQVKRTVFYRSNNREMYNFLSGEYHIQFSTWKKLHDD